MVAQLNDLVECVRALKKPPAEAPLQTQRNDSERSDAPWPQMLSALERLSERLFASRTAGTAESEAAATASTAQSDWLQRHAEQQLQLQQVLNLLADRIGTQTAALQSAPAATSAPGKRSRTVPTESPALAVALREEQLKQALDEFSERLLGKPP